MTALRDIKVPYILTCLVTGLVKSYTSKEFVQRKIDNYGGDEQAMKDGFVCKDAKRELKALGDLSKVTESDIQKVITELGGTESAKTALERIQGGKLFLTKKVKVRNAKQGAAASKKTSTKKTSGAKQGKAKPAKSSKKSSKKTQGAKSETPAADSTPSSETPAEGAAKNQGSKQGHKQGAITEKPVATEAAAS